ncbi:MAG: beta-lactamase family protein [Thermoleophilia bacterium]|nr:beta-lactamase family protein [Thermoleophilia bacterium]
MRRRLALVLLVVAGCGGANHSPQLTTAVEAVVAAGVPGALALVREGDRIDVTEAGYADAAAHVNMQPAARFRAASVTKLFVATVVLQLVAEGRLRLDEPVSHLLPDLLPDGGRITIRELLAHRSGLADVADDPEVLDGARSTWPPRRLIALAAALPRTTAPDGAFRYSSTNYLVLGLVIERVTGRGLASQLRSRIIERLGLADTTFTPGRIAGSHVHGYTLPAHQGVVDPTAEPRDLDTRSAAWAWAAGDLVSSARDLARFLAALLEGELLPRAQLRAMEHLQSRYGLGLAVYRTRCGLAWGHTGNLNGVLTIAWSRRDGSRQAVVVANVYPLAAAADLALRRAAVTAFCG